MVVVPSQKAAWSEPGGRGSAGAVPTESGSSPSGHEVRSDVVHREHPRPTIARDADDDRDRCTTARVVHRPFPRAGAAADRGRRSRARASRPRLHVLGDVALARRSRRARSGPPTCRRRRRVGVRSVRPARRLVDRASQVAILADVSGRDPANPRARSAGTRRLGASSGAVCERTIVRLARRFRAGFRLGPEVTRPVAEAVGDRMTRTSASTHSVGTRCATRSVLSRLLPPRARPSACRSRTGRSRRSWRARPPMSVRARGTAHPQRRVARAGMPRELPVRPRVGEPRTRSDP
jgi:hypothetical protein